MSEETEISPEEKAFRKKYASQIRTAQRGVLGCGGIFVLWVALVVLYHRTEILAYLGGLLSIFGAVSEAAARTFPN